MKRAVEDMGTLIGNHPPVRSTGQALVEGFLRDITGGAREAQRELRSWTTELQDQLAEYKRCEREMEDVAIGLGVSIPPKR